MPRPKPFTVNVMEVQATHVVRLNTKNHRCNEDPGYSPVGCMEGFVQRRAGCASPWDITANKVGNCYSAKNTVS